MIQPTLLCYHMGMETYNVSILFSLSSLFSPFMLNLTSEGEKKKKKKDVLHLNNWFTCVYANSFFLEILQILS